MSSTSSQTNIFHALQPKHSILKQKESEDLLQELNVSLTQLPKIKITDPAIPENANIGDVVKIERKDEFAESGKTVYYRVVVA